MIRSAVLSIAVFCALLMSARSFASGTASQVQALNFGTIVPTSLSGGTVSISYAGAVSPSGVQVSGATAFGIAQYETQSNRCKCTLTFNGFPTSMTLSGSNGGQLTVANFQSVASNYIDAGANCTYSGGNYAKTFWQQPPYAQRHFGATVSLDSSAKPGTYTGTFMISAEGQEKDQTILLWDRNRCGTTQNGYDAGAATATMYVYATVEWPLTVAKLRDMEFGQVFRNLLAPCTVVMAPDGTRGGSCSTANQKVAQSASFRISGVGGAPIKITLPSAQIFNNMTLGNFTASTTLTPTVGLDGNLDVQTGATITVPAAQPAGRYSTSYTVVVDYN